MFVMKYGILYIQPHTMSWSSLCCKISARAAASSEREVCSSACSCNICLSFWLWQGIVSWTRRLDIGEDVLKFKLDSVTKGAMLIQSNISGTTAVGLVEIGMSEFGLPAKAISKSDAFWSGVVVFRICARSTQRAWYRTANVRAARSRCWLRRWSLRNHNHTRYAFKMQKEIRYT